jgi:ABC-type multidrug transport system fused ATPase/permease subunit
MLEWFYETSVWITLPLFVGGFVLVSCLIVFALRPVVRRLVADGKEWDRALAHVIGTFGVFFGILLALVAVSVYENFSYTRQVSIDESGRVGALYRATTGLPEDVGDQLRQLLDEYMHAVIEGDFPQQQLGILPNVSDTQVDEFERVMHTIEAAPGDDQAEFQQVLATFDDVIESRRARIDATALALPPLLWLVIWVGAAVNAVLIAFIYVKSRRLHLLMAGLLAVFIGLVIFVTADMDHPYAGAVSVDAGAFERVLEQIIDARE